MASREDQAIPASEAFGLEARKATMRDVVRLIAQHGALKIENAPAIAKTYTVPVPCVEAEMMKHLSESEGK